MRNSSVPGAQVQDINKLFPNILNQHQEIESITVHVGFNDIMKGSSEQPKMDFKRTDSVIEHFSRHLAPVTIYETIAALWL